MKLPSKVYLVWGLRYDGSIMPIGLYYSRMEAYDAYSDLSRKAWKWADVKEMEIK